MQWIIIKDIIGDGARNGTVSRGFDATKPTPFPFEIYDDDGILYYTGFSSDHDSEDAFAPLDDFAQPNDGATEIRYRAYGLTGNFEVL
jgi:hypothetical protein